MKPCDIDAVMAIAEGLDKAPHWTRDRFAFLEDTAVAPHRLAWVAEASGGVVGFVVAGCVAPQGEIESIAVAEAWQRRGIARALLGAAAEILESRGVTEILLEVRASNLPAQSFYRALGFEEVSTRKAYYSAPVEDAVVLRVLLPIPPEIN